MNESFIHIFYLNLERRMNKLIQSIINTKRRESMDQKYNTGDDATVELKKAIRKSTPNNNPNMSEAEMKLKSQGKKS
jgi:3-isopropylmalate dehydratase small subunit